MAYDDVVAESSDPLVRTFRDFWMSKRSGGALQSRADFDVMEFRPWFGHVILMDVIEGGKDFRYRLIGTHITEFLRRDLTGRLVSNCSFDRGLDNVLDSFRRPLITGGPVMRSGKVVWSVDQSWHYYHSVHCPLASDGVTPDMTVGVVVFGQAG